MRAGLGSEELTLVRDERGVEHAPLPRRQLRAITHERATLLGSSREDPLLVFVFVFEGEVQPPRPRLLSSRLIARKNLPLWHAPRRTSLLHLLQEVDPKHVARVDASPRHVMGNGPAGEGGVSLGDGSHPAAKEAAA